MSSPDSVSSPMPSAPPSSPQVPEAHCPNPKCQCPPPCPCMPPCTCGTSLESSATASSGWKPEPMEVYNVREPQRKVTFPEQPDSCKLRKKGVYCLTHYVLPALAGAAVLFGAFRLVRFARTYRA